TDGTTAGTTILKDFNPGGGNANAFFRSLADVNGTLYFGAPEGLSSSPTGLWKSDGTPAGTVQISMLNGRYPNYLTAVNGTSYFFAPDGSNQALWKSDGTAPGTAVVVDLTTLGLYENLTNAGGTLFFTGPVPGGGHSTLWQSDGTAAGTTVVNSSL